LAGASRCIGSIYRGEPRIRQAEDEVPQLTPADRAEVARTQNRSPIDAVVALWALGITPTVERFEI
jgi:hypothetical protein